jgi:hypothetical protein
MIVPRFARLDGVRPGIPWPPGAANNAFLRISKQHDRRIRPAMPTIIRRDRPEEAFFRAAAAGIENQSRRFIHEDAVRRGETLAATGSR